MWPLWLYSIGFVVFFAFGIEVGYIYAKSKFLVKKSKTLANETS